MKIAISACLLGIDCKYNGKNNLDKKLIDLKDKCEIIPICPEKLGGLPTPRLPSEIVGNKVLRIDGLDVTNNFINGANKAYEIISKEGIHYAILKANSPSCGKGYIYDGHFTGRLVSGNGITTQFLLAKGIKVFTENDEYIKILE